MLKIVIFRGETFIVSSQIRGEWGSKSVTCGRSLGETKKPTPWCLDWGCPERKTSHPFLTKVCEEVAFVSRAKNNSIPFCLAKQKI